MSDNLINPDSSNPDFWDYKYNNNDDQWDIGAPTPIIVDWFKKNKSKKKIIIPGCGNGHDAIHLAKEGHDVYAVDFSINAINNLKNSAKNNNVKLNILHKDFFKLQNYYGFFDIFVEYTFFCAILPNKRNKYIRESYELLNPNGIFLGILLPINKKEEEGGPPYGVDLKKTLSSFKKLYNLIECSRSKLSIKPRNDKERFILMEK